ncbi:MAG: DegV family protein [Eubacteriales bacterium]
MSKLCISVDSTTPTTEALKAQHNIIVVPLQYKMNGEFKLDAFIDEVDTHSFYEQLMNGATPTSTKAKAESFVDAWRGPLEDDQTILHLSISSKVSETYHSACIARDALLKKYPGRIMVVDTLIGGYDITEIAVKSSELYAKGASVEEITLWIHDHAENYNMILTVDDLSFLSRGGKISNVKALIGTVLNMKPALYVTNEGKFEQLHTRSGSARALDAIIEAIHASSNENTTWLKIQHGGDQQAALELIDKVKSKLSYITRIEMSILSPVLGLHGGPGSLAIYFEGKNRDFLGTL